MRHADRRVRRRHGRVARRSRTASTASSSRPARATREADAKRTPRSVARSSISSPIRRSARASARRRRRSRASAARRWPCSSGSRTRSSTRRSTRSRPGLRPVANRPRVDPVAHDVPALPPLDDVHERSHLPRRPPAPRQQGRREARTAPRRSSAGRSREELAVPGRRPPGRGLRRVPLDPVDHGGKTLGELHLAASNPALAGARDVGEGRVDVA